MDSAIIHHRSPASDEIVLGELAGQIPTERIVIVLRTAIGPGARGNRGRHSQTQAERGTAVELRQQSWGPGIGWYTQSTVRLSPDQLGQLRAVLGNVHRQRPDRPATAVAENVMSNARQTMNRDGTTAAVPFRVVRAESA